MLNQIKTVALRSRATLVQDLAGAASLVVILCMTLYLPAFF